MSKKKQAREKLFENIPETIFQMVLNRLAVLRQLHPSYRDDQLLLFALCIDALDMGYVS